MSDAPGHVSHPWFRLLPPRGPRGSSQNIVRQRVNHFLAPFNDTERNFIADGVERFERRESVGLSPAKFDAVLAIVALRLEYPEFLSAPRA